MIGVVFTQFTYTSFGGNYAWLPYRATSTTWILCLGSIFFRFESQTEPGGVLQNSVKNNRLVHAEDLK